MFSLKINGFRDEAEARAFIEWYEGQGEQDATIWFECRMEEGEIDRDFIGVDIYKPYVVEGDTLIAWVEEFQERDLDREMAERDMPGGFN
jgi:hypothetical protein